MKNKQTREQDEIEDARLKLALLKRHHAYRTSFEKLKRNFQIEDGLLSSDCEDILFCEMGFSTFAAPYIDRAARDGVLFEILDPEKDIDGTHADNLLYFMFYFEGIKEIKRPDLRVNYEKMAGRALENPLIDPKNLEDYERLLIVDLRKPKWSLVREFRNLIGNTYALRKMTPGNIADFIKNRPKELAREWSVFKKRVFRSFESWKPDTRRSREEAWIQLKIWDLWKNGQGFKQIAPQVNMSRAAVKMAFHAAYTRIYNRPYDAVDVWENESRKTPKPDIKQFCKDCTRQPCKTPCPEYLEYIETYISQDFVSQKEKPISFIRNLPQDCEDPLSYLNEKNKKIAKII